MGQSDVVARLRLLTGIGEQFDDELTLSGDEARALHALISSLVAERDQAYRESQAWADNALREVGELRVLGESWKDRALTAERLLAEARAATELLLRRIDPILDQLGPGGYLVPAGAVLTNNLEAARNEARASIGGGNG